MRRKLDNTLLGAAIGIIAPSITFLIILTSIYPHEFADESLRNMWLYMAAPSVLSIAAIPNLAFFFLFIYTNRLKSARGVLGATILFAITVFIIKLSN
ncbi:MAG: hypothetical protein ACLFNU_07185 [Bacteroidales bacterium]